MSVNQITADQQQVLAASSNILKGVYAPTFLQKMAERGYQATNNKEAEELLELGFKLAEMGAQPTEPTSKFASAVGALSQLSNGTAAVAEYQYKQAAVQLAQDPAIYVSALLLQQAEQ